MGRSVTVGSLLLALASRAWADGDTVDINVVVYKDPNCFEKVDQFVQLDEGCYANRYDNLTRAFELKIVVFDEGAQKVDLREYVDDCWPVNLFRPARTIEVGKCEAFVGGFYAITGLRWRSTTCVGMSCSPISVAMQRFYSEEECEGVGVKTHYYPVQGECMRWNNGTQEFTLDPTGKNISQLNYNMNDGCNGADKTAYWMMSGKCYSLHSDPGTSPKSFKWQVELGKNYASVLSGAHRPTSAIIGAAVVGVAAWWAVAAAASPVRLDGAGPRALQ